MEQHDVIDLRDADREPLSKAELIQLETNLHLIRTIKSVVCRQLTPKNLSNALSYYQQGINILLKNDYNEDWNIKVFLSFKIIINYYIELQYPKNRKAKRQTLDEVFKSFSLKNRQWH